MREEQWWYLLDLQHTHSLNMTSKKFDITPQALGKSLRNLEKEIGFSVLNRSHVGVFFTQEGEAFLELETHFFTGLNQLRTDYDNASNRVVKQPFKLWISQSALECEVSQLLEEYAELFPWLDIHIIESSFKEIVYRLQKKDIRFGVCSMALSEGSRDNQGILPGDVQFIPIKRADTQKFRIDADEYEVLAKDGLTGSGKISSIQTGYVMRKYESHELMAIVDMHINSIKSV